MRWNKCFRNGVVILVIQATLLSKLTVARKSMNQATPVVPDYKNINIAIMITLTYIFVAFWSYLQVWSFQAMKVLVNMVPGIPLQVYSIASFKKYFPSKFHSVSFTLVQNAVTLRCRIADYLACLQISRVIKLNYMESYKLLEFVKWLSYSWFWIWS